MYVVLAELEVFSTISIFFPLASTSVPVYPLPPPTTLVGALAYAYLRSKDPKECEYDSSSALKILNYISYATAGSEGYQIIRDIERIYQEIYQRKQRWGLEEYRYTVGVRGSVVYLNNKLYVLYISRNLDLAKYVYGIVRIGRKEGHVAVHKVVINETKNVIRNIGKGVFRTMFYTPKRIAYCTENTSIIMSMPKLVQNNFMQTPTPELEEYYVPRGMGIMQCELGDNGVLLTIQDLEIAIPRDYI